LPDTDPAEAVNVADVAPAETVTEPGTLRALLLSESATLEPPLGPAPVRVTVQVALVDGASDDGEQPKLLSVTWPED